MKRLNSFLFAFVLICFAAVACERSENTSPDSESHFLDRCNDACGAGLTCLCGVCTAACSSSTECAALASAAVCGPGLTEAGNACQSSPAPQTCDLACSASDACLPLGDGYACERGLCRRTAAAPSGGTTQSLRVALPDAAANSKAVAFWDVQVGDQDGAYKFGEATIVDGVAQLELLPLPADAVQAGTVVGGLVIVPRGTVLADGLVDTTALQAYPLMKGFLVYRPGGALADASSWGADFPNGYACGVCQPAVTGFDRVEPSACSEAKSVVSVADFGCNYS